MTHNGTLPKTAVSNPVESLLGYHIRRASTALWAELNQSLGEIELTVTEASVLMLIGTHDGITQSEIGRLLGIKRANMAPLTAHMTTRGLVDRVQVDGRSQLLKLTPKGVEIVKQTHQRVEEHDRRLCPDLSPKARRELIQNLETIWR